MREYHHSGALEASVAAHIVARHFSRWPTKESMRRISSREDHLLTIHPDDEHETVLLDPESGSRRRLEVQKLWEDSIVFRYASAEKVLEHLLKSRAGTAFYDAIDPVRREALTARFLHRLTQRHEPGMDFEVRHEYVACVPGKACLTKSVSLYQQGVPAAGE